jgi:uncharacterized protein (DUF433 family)
MYTPAAEGGGSVQVFMLNYCLGINTDLLNRITINPDVMVGKPTIRGLRITVEHILQAMASGVSVEDILADYPELENEDIQAVLLYAAELVNEEKVFSIH